LRETALTRFPREDSFSDRSQPQSVQGPGRCESREVVAALKWHGGAPDNGLSTAAVFRCDR
jgi:hypothetical protein